ncbi:hypothetical protein DFH28DRAFT_475567 [Melampsora americana]|nr:hypothetical protein DFH28DRAFT_475567 [Melampsora americana]
MNQFSSKINSLSIHQYNKMESTHTTLIALILPIILLFFLTSITMLCFYLKKIGSFNFFNPILSSSRRRQDSGIAWSFQFPQLTNRNSNVAVSELASCSTLLVLKTTSYSESQDESKQLDEKNLEVTPRLEIGLPNSPWSSHFACSSIHGLGQSLPISIPNTPIRSSDRGTRLFHKRPTIHSRLWEKWHLPTRLRPKSNVTEVYIIPPQPVLCSDHPYDNRRVTRSGLEE